MSAEAPKGHDWARARSLLLSNTKQHPALNQSEIERGFREHANDDGWWEAFIQRYPHAGAFPERSSSVGAVILVGSGDNIHTYRVIDTHQSIPGGNDEHTVLQVQNEVNQLKILKRVSPTEAIDFVLTARELQNNGILGPKNTRMLTIDNPWFDTIEYDFISGVPADDYVGQALDENISGFRLMQLSHYFDTVIKPLALGRLLPKGRAYLPGDINAGGIIVSDPQSDTPTFSLIDLDRYVVSDPYTFDDVTDAREHVILPLQLTRSKQNHTVYQK